MNATVIVFIGQKTRAERLLFVSLECPKELLGVQFRNSPATGERKKVPGAYLHVRWQSEAGQMIEMPDGKLQQPGLIDFQLDLPVHCEDSAHSCPLTLTAGPIFQARFQSRCDAHS